MRISSFAGSDMTTVAEAVARVRAAADAGFDAIWFPQTMSLDALTALAVAGREVQGIDLGTAVVPIQGRHPIPMAQQALTTADAAGAGRFTLGIGVTHKPVSEGWYGIPYSTMVDQCREQLEALVPLLSASRTADMVGTHMTARLTLPIPGPQPRLVLAALGPKMLALAGRFTDGTVTWMTGVRTIERDVVPALQKAAADAGRADPRVVVGLPVCVTTDLAGARERVGKAMGYAMQLNSYRRMVDAEGVAEPVDIALVGSESEVAERIAGLEAAGATELLANVMGDPDERAATTRFLGGLAGRAARVGR